MAEGQKQRQRRNGWKVGERREERTVSFDIDSRVIRAVIVCEPHLGETDSPICLSNLFISFCLSPSLCPLFFMTSSGGAQWTLRKKKKEEKNQFPEQFSNSHPREMLSIKISYNHSSGISKVRQERGVGGVKKKQ